MSERGGFEKRRLKRILGMGECIKGKAQRAENHMIGSRTRRISVKGKKKGKGGGRGLTKLPRDGGSWSWGVGQEG